MSRFTELKRFGKAAFHLTWRVVKRSTLAIMVLMVRVSVIYADVVRPKIAPAWRDIFDVATAFVSQYALAIAAIIVIASIYYTYYEVERQLRDPRITKRLKQFYREADALARRRLTDVAEVATLRDEWRAKNAETYHWIRENMEPEALMRVNQRSPSGFAGFRMATRPDALNAEHSGVIDDILSAQRGLLAVIEQPVWL